MNLIAQSLIRDNVTDELKNTLGSSITEAKFIRAANRAIDILHTRGNYATTRRINTFGYLDGENDYDIEDNLGIEDFKQIEDLRPVDGHTFEWDFKDEKTIARWIKFNIGADAYGIEERHNQDILRVIHNSDKTSTTLHAMDSLTADGTWGVMTSTVTDSANLTVDTARFKEGGASLNFDIDVSVGAGNLAGIELTTAMTAQDISGFENIGRFRMWWDFQKLTAAELATISTVELRFGSSNSNYRAITADKNILNGNFVSNWNRVNFNWEDGTDTGTPDYANMDYLAAIVNYTSSMTDATDIRVDEIKLFEPKDLDLVYFSNFMVNKAGTWQAHFSTTYDGAEELLLPQQHLDVIVSLILTILFPMKKKDNDPTWQRFQNRYEDGFQSMFEAIGSSIEREDLLAKIHGNSSGRAESHLMWG